jgi:hypothetical protein
MTSASNGPEPADPVGSGANHRERDQARAAAISDVRTVERLIVQKGAVSTMSAGAALRASPG